MKRTPLKRKTPLRTKRRMVRKAPRRLKRAGSDPAYLERVRGLPCVLVSVLAWETVPNLLIDPPFTDHERCWGSIEAHHAGKRPGVGMKCSDRETHPFCHRHHQWWTDHAGWFAGWSKYRRRKWADERIAETQRKLGLVKESA